MRLLSSILLFAVLSCGLTPAMATQIPQTLSEVQKAEFNLNQNIGAKNQLGTLVTVQKKGVLRGSYDFALQGGAIGVLQLKGMTGQVLKLPQGAIVSDCLLDFRTAFTSGGAATISFGTGQAANDLKSALAVASATGLVSCIPVGSAATAIKLTADRTPTMTIAAAALTAGKVNVLVEYWLSNSP